MKKQALIYFTNLTAVQKAAKCLAEYSIPFRVINCIDSLSENGCCKCIALKNESLPRAVSALNSFGVGYLGIREEAFL